MLTDIKRSLYRVCGCIVISTVFSQAWAASYTLQNMNDSVIGEIDIARAELKDTMLDIARAHGLGYQDIKLLNPEVDTWLPGEGMEILLPLQFVLPDAPKEGIVLNIPEMRLYYYPPKKRNQATQVVTYPLGVGREGWSTPYVKTQIIEKKTHPNWYPPESIRAEHEEAGDPLPKIVKAGPDNPLGDHALRLGIPQYLIHGTNKPFGIGMRISHGCIRLYPEDIESLFNEVKIGTPVKIVNQPYKVGKLNGVIYLEAHPHLQEDAARYAGLTEIVRLIVDVTQEQSYQIDWNLVDQVVSEHKGIPVAIGMQIPEMLQASVEDEYIEEEIFVDVTVPEATVKNVSVSTPTLKEVTNSTSPRREISISKSNNGVNLRLDTEIARLPD